MSALQVFGTQQIVHGFYRIECGNGHFNKKGNPMCHGAIPKAGEFLWFHGLGSFGFLGDESGVWVYEFVEVKMTSPEVADGAYEIYRIEVGRALE